MEGFIKRNYGEHITLANRSESEQKVDKAKRRMQVLDILKENNKPMTAKEVAVEMFRKYLTFDTDRNNAAPRLTELAQMGLVDTIGKIKCKYTGKMVTVYELRKNEG